MSEEKNKAGEFGQERLAVIIGKNITRLRKMANMTQLELAEKLNYSDKSVSKWEQGNGVPDVRILIQIADLFGVTLDDLVKEHKERKVMPKNTRLLRRVIIMACSVGLCWLAAVAAFVFLWLFSSESSAQYAWLAFVYAVPVSSVVLLVFSCVWHYKWMRVIVVSVIIWTVLACAYLTTCVLVPGYPYLWFIFLIGVPLQVLTLFFFVWWKRAKFFKP